MNKEVKGEEGFDDHWEEEKAIGMISPSGQLGNIFDSSDTDRSSTLTLMSYQNLG